MVVHLLGQNAANDEFQLGIQEKSEIKPDALRTHSNQEQKEVEAFLRITQMSLDEGYASERERDKNKSSVSTDASMENGYI